MKAARLTLRRGAEEIELLIERRAERPVCMYSEEPTHDVLDPNNLPPVEQLRCYTREEYQQIA